MIRINLLAGDRRATKAQSWSLQAGQKITLLGSLLLVITALLIGLRYWSIQRDQARLAADLEAARREEARLAEVLKEVADLEAREATLQQRKTLINELRRGQSAPVHMIDQVSRALPEMTWLTSLKQDGYDITLEGHCLSLTSLSDFVANLEASEYFKRPVEILDSSVGGSGRTRSAQQDGPELIRFVVKGTFQMAGIEQKPAAAPARTAARGR
jgi:type IV pilus assembly protein PilN